jgi:carboxyl-terminal processing protease
MSFGLMLGLGAALARADDAGDDSFHLFVQVVEQRLGDQVDRDELYRAALDGAASYLDDRFGTVGNRILSRAEYESADSWDRGHRVGIGVEFEIVGGQGLLVTDVFTGSAAQDAGLVRGDLVVGLDGQPFTGQPGTVIHQIVARSSSPTHRLDVRRRDGLLRRVTVAQGPYQVDTASLVAGSDPPEIRIHFFGQGVAGRLREQIAQLGNPAALVLDVRDNEGGLLSEMVAVSALFLEEGSLVVQRAGADGHTSGITTEAAPVFGGRLGVVVNAGTRGLAEGFVASLQDHQRAIVVGTNTGGQATLPTYYPLGRDLVLELQDQFLRSPLGRDWSRRGIEPHQLVESPQLTLPGGQGWVPPDLQRDAARKLISSP